jgi:hypothetical protein
LHEIAAAIERRIGAKVQKIPLSEDSRMIKLNVNQAGALVKLEVSPVLRGSVFNSEVRAVSSRLADIFGYAEMKLLSFDDLYAGKLCAALDRQHPRDWYDVKILLENEGITDSLKRAFLVYLISHNRPIAELLDPNLIDMSEAYHAEFEGMLLNPVSLAELERVRVEAIAQIRAQLTDKDKQFLLSVKSKDPDWSYLGLPHIGELPAVRWKLRNLARMDAAKQQDTQEKLAKVLYG